MAVIRASALERLDLGMDIEKKVLHLANALEARRKSLGLSQVELAGLAGVSARFMYDLENGKKSVSLEKVLAVATVLGFEIEFKVAQNG